MVVEVREPGEVLRDQDGEERGREIGPGRRKIRKEEAISERVTGQKRKSVRTTKEGLGGET